MKKVIQLHPEDNILVVRRQLEPGEQELINGELILFQQSVGLGHKLAARSIAAGELIIKYGVHIGSATQAIAAGAHVHLHNMKSDYLPTYTLEKEFIDEH